MSYILIGWRIIFFILFYMYKSEAPSNNKRKRTTINKDKEEEVNLIKEVLEDFLIDVEKFKGGKNQLEKEIRTVLLKNKIEKDLNINSNNKIKRKI